MALTKADIARINERKEQVKNGEVAEGAGGTSTTGSSLTKADLARIRERKAQIRSNLTTGQKPAQEKTGSDVFQRHSFAPSIDRVLGTDPIARSAATQSGYYSNPVRNFDAGKLQNELTRLQDPYAQAMARVQTAGDDLTQADAQLKALETEVDSLYDSYTKNPSEAMAAAYTAAYEAYESAWSSYETARSAYETAYAAYEPVHKDYSTAVGAYNWFVDQYGAWRSSVRDGGSVSKELSEVEALLAQVETRLQRAKAPTAQATAYGAISGAVGGELDAQLPELEAYRAQLLQRRELLQEELGWRQQFDYEDYRQKNEQLSAKELAEQLRRERSDRELARLRAQEQATFAAGGSAQGGSSPEKTYDPTEAVQAIADYWAMQEQLEGDRRLLEQDLAELERWPEADRAALERYAAQRDTQWAAAATGSSVDSAAWTERALIEKYGLAKVDQMAESWKRGQNAQLMEQARGAGESLAQRGFWSAAGSSLLSVGANLVGNYTGPLGYMQELSQRTGRYSTLDPNNPGAVPGEYAAAVRKTVGEKIGSTGGKYLYDATLSAVDNLLRVYASGGMRGGSLLMAGVGSFGRSVQEKSAQGATPAEALLLGTIDGGLEAATEMIGLDDLLNIIHGSPLSPAQVLRSILKQGVTEVAEEELTFLGSTLAEAAVLRERSAYQQQINELVAGGMSHAQAVDVADRQLVMEAAQTAIQSFLSGELMAAGGVVTNAGRYASLGKQLRKDGISDEEIRAFIETGLSSDPKSDSYLIAQQLQKKLAAGKALTNWELGALYAANIQAVAQDQVGQKVDSAATSENVAGEETSIIQQIRNHTDELAGMEPVGSISAPESFRKLDKASKMQWVIEKLRPTGYKVDRKGFGIIDFSEKRLKSAFNYFRKGSSEEKVFELLPYVLEHGKDITARDNHKGRAYGTVTIAAPVTVNGKRGNMAVVVKKTTGNYYKVHRILSPDGSKFVLDETKEAEPTPGGGVAETSPLATPISSASTDTIAEPSVAVKTEKEWEELSPVQRVLVEAAERFIDNEDHRLLIRQIWAAQTDEEALRGFTDRGYAIPDGVEELMPEEIATAGDAGLAMTPSPETGAQRNAEDSVPYDGQSLSQPDRLTAPFAQGSLGAQNDPTEEAGAEEVGEVPQQRLSRKDELVFRMRSRPLQAHEVQKLERLENARDDLEATGVFYDVEQKTIDSVRQAAELTGARVVFQPMAAGNGKIKAGRYIAADDTIYLNPKAPANTIVIFAHELTHSLEKTGAYAQLRQAVENRLRAMGRDVGQMAKDKIAAYKAAGVRLTEDGAMKEIVAEFVSEHLLSNEAEIRALTQRNRGLGQRIRNWLDRILARLGNKNAQERKFLEHARDLYTLALAQKQVLGEMDRDVAQLQEQYAAGQISDEEYDLRRELIDRKYGVDAADAAGGDGAWEQYLISPTLENDLNEIYNLTFNSQNNELYIGESSQFLTGTIGAKLLSQTMPANKAYNAMATEAKAKLDHRFDKDENYHGLGVEGLKEALIASENPVAAFVAVDDENGTRRDRIVLVTDNVGADGPIVAIVQVETEGHLRGRRVRVNKTITSYDRRSTRHDILEAAANGRLLYLDKKRSQQILAGTPGSNYQEAIRGVDFKKNIQQFWDNVNWEKSGKTAASSSDGNAGTPAFAEAFAKAQADKAAREAKKAAKAKQPDEIMTDGATYTDENGNQFSILSMTEDIRDGQYSIVDDDTQQTAVAAQEAEEPQTDIWDAQSSTVRQSLLAAGRELTDQLAADFGIAPGVARHHLSPIIKGMWREYLANVAESSNWQSRKLEDRISRQTLRQLFDTAWSKGDVQDKNRATGSFMRALSSMNSQLKMVERLIADDQTAAEERAVAEEKALQEPAAPKKRMSLEEAETLLRNTKRARNTAERVRAKTPLTRSDKEKLDLLMRRELYLNELDPSTDNVDGIRRVFEAMQDYEALAREVRAYRRSLKAERLQQADDLLVNAEGWTDKLSGLQYSRETMERNIRDIVKDPTLAQKIIDTYIKPVKKANAKANQLKNKLRDRIRETGISRKVDKKAGNSHSESYAVQFLGEAQSYIRQLKGKGDNAKAGGMTLAEWESAVLDFKNKNPGMDFDKVQRAIEVFGKIYEELYGQINTARIRNGYEPMGHRDGYFPHFRSWEATGLWARFMETLGYRNDVTPLPTEIAGRTEDFKPGMKWMAHAQERKGYKTTYDALEGFDRYIETAADVIYLTDCIQNIRALGEQVRYRTGEQGLRARVEAVRREDISEEDKRSKIDEIMKDGRFSLSNFAVALDDYANILAGKKHRADRNMEQLLGRGSYNLARWFEKQSAANQVAGNIASAVTNLVPFQQGWAAIPRKFFWKGLGEAFVGKHKSDGFRSRSDFLINRMGSTPLAMTTLDRISTEYAGWLMENIDMWVAEGLVRARYYENLDIGLSEEAAIDEADDFVSGLMADRSKGAMPSLFNINNPLAKLITQFQLEVNNQFSFMLKDLPRNSREPDRKKLGLAILQLLLGAYVFNDIYEKLFGRRVAFDPVHVVNEAVGDLTGFQLPNIMDLPFDAIKGEFPEFRTERQGLWKTLGNLGTNVLEEMPFMAAANLVGWDIDAGRIPVSSAVPSMGNIVRAATDTDLGGKRKLDMLWDEFKKPLYFTIMPAAGGQIKKTLEGAGSLWQGGSYTVNTDGESVLQYPFYSDEGFWSLAEGAKTLLMGKSSTEAAQDWVEGGFGSLSVKQTAAYQAMIDSGAGQRESFELISQIRKTKKTDTLSEDAAKNRAVAASGLPHSAKAMLYETGALEYAAYKNARKFGLSPEDAYTLAESQFMLDPADGTEKVTKAQTLRAAYDAAGMSEEQQMRYLGSVLEGKQRDKLAACYSFGAPPGAYVRLQELLPEFDENGNGDYSMKEIEAAIDSMTSTGILLPGGDGTMFNLTTEHMAALWQSVADTDKASSNPYSRTVGQEFLDLINEE